MTHLSNISSFEGNFGTPSVPRMQTSKKGKKDIENSLQGSNKFEMKSTTLDMFRSNVKKFHQIVGAMKKEEVKLEVQNMIQECKNHRKSTKNMMDPKNGEISPEEGKKILTKIKYIRELISAIGK